MKSKEITSLSLGKQQMDFQTSDLLFHESRYASWLKTVRGAGGGGVGGRALLMLPSTFTVFPAGTDGVSAALHLPGWGLWAR